MLANFPNGIMTYPPNTILRSRLIAGLYDCLAERMRYQVA